MADTTPRLLSERTNFRVIIGSAVVGGLGLLLLWLSTDDNWWSTRQLWWLSGKNLQSTINSFGALLIATVPVTLFWEIWGKRRFLDEVLAKARVAKELEDAGFTNAYDSFQRIVEWKHFFQNANEIDIFFVYGHSWRSNNREFIKQFLQRRHSRLRVILPDPEDHTTTEELARQFGYTVQNVQERIVEALNDFKALAPDGKKLEIYYFSGMTPHLSFYRFGAVSVFCPYNHNPERAPVPAFVVRDGGFLFGYLRDEFTVIRKHSRRAFPGREQRQEGRAMQPINPATIPLHQADLPSAFCEAARRVGTVACDIETSGLDWRQDRIAICQLYIPDHESVVLRPIESRPERLIALMEDGSVRKLFHHAMFDLRFLAHKWRCDAANVACTKIGSKLLDRGATSYSLTHLLSKFLGIELDKHEQKSDWFRATLSPEQIKYAISDVIYLPRLMDVLLAQLTTAGLRDYAERCFTHIPTQVWLEVEGYSGLYEY